MDKNNIVNPAATYELAVASGTPGAETLTLDAPSNWWGTADTDGVAAKIRDHSDDYRVPSVAVTPLLSGPEPTAGVQ